MNTRSGKSDILMQSPWNSGESHYDTVLQYIQSDPTIVYVPLTAILAYFALAYFGLVPFGLPQGVWNLIVYLTPSRIVVALDSKSNTANENTIPLPMTFQAKSEAMQRILRIDSTSFSSFLSRGTSLSGFGNAILGSKDSLPPGLGNWDNSCFQNSIIQGFASLRSLVKFLGRNIEVLGEKGSFSTHQALQEIVGRLNDAAEYGQKLWIPPNLKSMSSWQQQDAQEYFSKVVDQIDREVQQASKRQTRNLGLKMAGPEENVVGSGSSQNGKDSDFLSSQSDTPSFRNPLEGLLAQRVGCMKCGWTEGLSLIPFNCLTVPLGSKFEYDIRECLDHYMDLEPIEGVECAKCTLLRAREQLHNLVKQVEEDEQISNSLDSPKLSDALKNSAQERLQAVEEALEENDFAEKTLSNKCHIPSKNRASSTKSRQAVIARSPKCLVIHINRSLFDENTGMLRKNYAAVRFPQSLDLNHWCLGAKSVSQISEFIEKWGTDPKESMLPRAGTTVDVRGRQYELRAIITHYGRHENGHYIAYRKYPTDIFPAHVPEAVLEADGEKEKPERWYRLSDEDVSMVSEASVLSQGGAFMLFYEALEPSTEPSTPQAELVDSTESTSSLATPEDMSTTSGITEGTEATECSASITSWATSVSVPEKVGFIDRPPLEAPLV
ncbi:ubiquitin-specific protease UBP1 [Aspergillus ruber CBS 135680]|uniref:ubiquitinyl hydrolase 1 n=1 Tax=Aspergillus ruber (strain CBS 135680) TaxID=1388766 RepID=A0A017S9T7_ASPRC|nr:putative ubiquitin C-terminal hydrolase [Aspergillus ruber CBS 135680]EYE92955.1 putative ubiquitin C-terminal hydrolase [Aspergillus ruber CBS 135680]